MVERGLGGMLLGSVRGAERYEKVEDYERMRGLYRVWNVGAMSGISSQCVL